jgi:ADP-ribose pyrophosphatase YjhB (NUDIX family)
VDAAELLDGLQAIAREGLDYADNPYDRARYHRLAELVERAYTDLTGLAAETVSERFRLDLGAPTAKVGTTAVVLDGSGRVLLQRRADDGRWGLPGGWLDPGELPEEGVVREVAEETGVTVEVERLTDVRGRRASLPATPHSQVGLTYLCRMVGGEPRPDHESLEVAWKHPRDVGEWHADHDERVQATLGRSP